jgi:hypothetical protein
MASSYGRQILQCGSNPKIAIPTIKDDNLNAFAIFLFFGLQVEEDIDVAIGRACVSVDS